MFFAERGRIAETDSIASKYSLLVINNFLFIFFLTSGRIEMVVESFPAERRSQAERPRNGISGKRSWFARVGNSERRPAIGKQYLALSPRRTGDGAACGTGGRTAAPGPNFLLNFFSRWDTVELRMTHFPAFRFWYRDQAGEVCLRSMI